jgi:hypothetical protein
MTVRILRSQPFGSGKPKQGGIRSHEDWGHAKGRGPVAQSQRAGKLHGVIGA